MWNPQHLARIIQADDLKIAPYYPDLTTTGTPTWIWCVQVDGDLYVRAYSGTASRWYQAALKQGAGRINAAGQQIEVWFEPVEGRINEAIDAAYRAKYAKSAYLGSMVSAGARAATVRISPAPVAVRQD